MLLRVVGSCCAKFEPCQAFYSLKLISSSAIYGGKKAFPYFLEKAPWCLFEITTKRRGAYWIKARVLNREGRLLSFPFNEV